MISKKTLYAEQKCVFMCVLNLYIRYVITIFREKLFSHVRNLHGNAKFITFGKIYTITANIYRLEVVIVCIYVIRVHFIH